MDTHPCIHRVQSRSMKDAQLRLRVERGLREEFGRACRLQGKHAAEVLRAFMRNYIVREGGGLQGSLLDGGRPSSGQTRGTSKPVVKR
jgi:hypothetical protein